MPSLKSLADIGVHAVIVITAGFKEMDKEGYNLEKEMTELCNERGIALVGPNCLGMETVQATHKLREQIKINHGTQLVNANVDLNALRDKLGI